MKKTKRKYTVTSKVLAANRRNLVLARKVDAKIRFRPTAKRLRACRANLARALAVLRSASLLPDGHRRPGRRPRVCVERGWVDSPGYGTGLTRGLWALSLRRSARLVGESAGAFDAHVDLFLRSLRPRTPRERRLARGIAEIVWRRLRVHHGQYRWQWSRLLYLLREAAAGPPAGAKAKNLPPAQEVAAALAEGLEEILRSGDDLYDATERLDARLERLSRLWVVVRGGDGALYQNETRPSLRDGSLAGLSPEAMGNPFSHHAVVDSSMRRHGEPGVGVISRQRWGIPRGFLRWQLWHDPTLFRLPKVSTAGPDHGAANPRGGLPTFEEFKTLWDAAWERIHVLHNAQNTNIPAGYITEDAGSRKEPASGTGDWRAANEVCAKQVWARLQICAHAALDEEREMQRLMTAHCGGTLAAECFAHVAPGGFRPSRNAGPTALLTELILFFNVAREAAFSASSSGRGWKATLHNFLVARFGPCEEFRWLMPMTIAEQPQAGTASSPQPADASVVATAPDSAPGAPSEGSEPVTSAYRSDSPYIPENWMRLRAAVACGMIVRRGWKREPHARSRARVGLVKRLKGEDKSLKGKG